MIEAEGKSEHWIANVTYELKTEKHDGKKVKMINNDGEIVYLKDAPLQKFILNTSILVVFPVVCQVLLNKKGKLAHLMLVGVVVA
jgi:hypothetical protein